MGWFWADTPSPIIITSTSATTSTKPPPSCPMNKSDSNNSPFNRTSDAAATTPSACPVKDPNHPLRSPPRSSQPPSDPASQSPQQSSTLSKYNPLNLIPTGITNTSSEGQTQALPLEREPSSIPRSDTNANWEYPSPQQMYNAMLRKGYTDTPIDAVESMVAVHNFLNEGAWAEIVEWEQMFAPGLRHGWKACSRGEGYIAFQRAKREAMAAAAASSPSVQHQQPPPLPEPKLVRFQGRPKEPTPKARILSLLGTVFPDSFGSNPPFDRHDWYVSRPDPNGSGSSREVRYVIDYYGGGVQETGEPVFYLDIRPALDSPTAVAERTIRWGGDLWWRASGGVARELEKMRKQEEAMAATKVEETRR